MKLKEFGPPGGGARPKFYCVDPPLAMLLEMSSETLTKMPLKIYLKCHLNVIGNFIIKLKLTFLMPFKLLYHMSLQMCL